MFNFHSSYAGNPSEDVHVKRFQSVVGKLPSSYANSVYGGAGGQGTKISSSGHSSFGGGYQSLSTASDTFTVGNEKQVMQDLNDRLASYLETVRNLEQANSKLELQIHEALEKRGPDVHDYSHYNAILEDLQQQIMEIITGNANLSIRIDNMHLAAEDFQVKLEGEIRLRQTTEVDQATFRNILDNINVSKMKLEGDFEALREELIVLKRNHEQQVLELHAQINQSGVRVDVDAPKGEDLGLIMEEMRTKYEKVVLKNQEEQKKWHNDKISEVQSVVTENTAALEKAKAEASETQRSVQLLEVELQSERNKKASMETALRDTEMRYNMEMEKYNAIILQLQAEFAELRGKIQQQTQEYEALLNIKMKLEAEIATYRKLLDGEDFKLEDSLEQKAETPEVMTATQTLVDDKVVSSSTETKESQF